jgi:hypothetical protein
MTTPGKYKNDAGQANYCAEPKTPRSHRLSPAELADSRTPDAEQGTAWQPDEAPHIDGSKAAAAGTLDPAGSGEPGQTDRPYTSQAKRRHAPAPCRHPRLPADTKSRTGKRSHLGPAARVRWVDRRATCLARRGGFFFRSCRCECMPGWALIKAASDRQRLAARRSSLCCIYCWPDDFYDSIANCIILAA